MVTEHRTNLLARLLMTARKPTDGAGLAAFRVMFGVLMAGATLRFVGNGWVDSLYVEPSFHFTYYGLDWIRPWPRPLLYAHFFLMGVAALLVAAGYRARLFSFLFCLLFTYVELLDKATYLNHYYLVTLLALLLSFIPTHRERVARGAYWLLRAQLGVVYFYAGLAKLNADWLLAAEPLSTWLRARSHLPVVGPLLGEPWLAVAMSWAGAVFDLGVPFLMSWRRSRPYAFACALVFHGLIWLLFPVGVFSFVMLVTLSVFFEPTWPRRWLGASWQRRLWGASAAFERRRATLATTPLPRHSGILRETLAIAYLIVQVLVPLRFVLYPGAVNWTEQGFRFAWRVMLIEKAGQVEFTVQSDSPVARFVVYPRRELTRLQYRQMATQPDMILEFAHHLRDRYRQLGYAAPRVTADAWVAFNGRPSRRLIDPERDLASVPRSLAAQDWIIR